MTDKIHGKAHTGCGKKGNRHKKYPGSAADAFGVIVQIHIGDRQSNKLAEYSDHKTEHKIGNDGAANLMFVKELSYADTGMYKKYIEKKAADSHQQKPDQNQRKRDDKIFLHPFHRN